MKTYVAQKDSKGRGHAVIKDGRRVVAQHLTPVQAKMVAEMLNKMRDKRSTGKVECVTDGTKHESAAAACRAYGIAESNMSKHLRGVPSHKTVGDGLKFERLGS